MATCSQQFGVSDVVWCTLDRSYPKWPCKIIKVCDEKTIIVDSFGDHCKRTLLSIDNTIGFTNDKEITADLIAKGKKRLKSRSDSLQLFNKSITEAIDCVKESDPQFELEYDITSDKEGEITEDADTKEETMEETNSPANVTRYGRPVKHLTTPSDDNSNQNEPRPKRHKARHNCLSCSKDSHKGTSLSPDKLLRQSISKVSTRTPVKVTRRQSVISPLPSSSSSSFKDSEDGQEVNGLKVNDIVWAKYQYYPFWPSVIDSIRCKKKTGASTKTQKFIRVYFLGVVDDAFTSFIIKSEKNIVQFNSSTTPTLLDIGRKSLKGKSFAVQFEQSVKEAEQLKKLRAENKISGTPFEQIEILFEMRHPFIEDLRSADKKRTNVNSVKEVDDTSNEGSIEMRQCEPRPKRRRTYVESSSISSISSGTVSQSDSEGVSIPSMNNQLQLSVKRVQVNRHNTADTTTSSKGAAIDGPETDSGRAVGSADHQLNSSSPDPEPPTHRIPTRSKVASKKSGGSSLSGVPSSSTESIRDRELPQSDATLSFNDVKANDVVWAKHHHCPFWPSVVESVQHKTKSGVTPTPERSTRVKVYFLGVLDDPYELVAIKSEKNIVLFDDSSTPKLMAEGRKSLKGELAKQFEWSVREAKLLEKMRAKNTISGTPREQIDLLVDTRRLYTEDLTPDEVVEP